jgi:deoxyribonuclease V
LDNALVTPSQEQMNRWRAIQRRLAKKVIQRDSFRKPPILVAGLDVAYHKDEAFSAAAVLNYRSLELVEGEIDRSLVRIPYVSSYLAFREVPPLTRVIFKLRRKVDAFLVNAHGVAHPARCGCASHLGVMLDIPTIGVARRTLCGTIPESEKGQTIYLKDGNDVIGAALTTSDGCRPIYVSVGHRVSLSSAIEIVQRTLRDGMPEPIRIAHKLSNETKRKYIDD